MNPFPSTSISIMNSPYFITALCTPLTDAEDLHQQGLEFHIQDQLNHGIDGLLVGGTMGAMQLLKESTYDELVSQSVEANAGRAEILIGVGDTSFVRTRDKLKRVDHLRIDGIVILAPFCVKFKQPELIYYYQTLADVSQKPVYLYDLPQMTGTKLEPATVLELAKHPNIAGIKCSDHLATARPLIDHSAKDFRVILAQPLLMDLLLRSGIHQHLDGIYGLVPHWIGRLKAAAQAGDWEAVVAIQKDVTAILDALIAFPAPLFATAAELLRQRGIPGNCAPAPNRRLTSSQIESLLAIPIVRKALQEPFSKP